MLPTEALVIATTAYYPAHGSVFFGVPTNAPAH
jgi:hypothetical protein